MLHGCDLLFTPESAEKVKGQVREMMGGQCPCDLDMKCPLLPEDLGPLLLPVPTLRESA